VRNVYQTVFTVKMQMFVLLVQICSSLKEMSAKRYAVTNNNIIKILHIVMTVAKDVKNVITVKHVFHANKITQD